MAGRCVANAEIGVRVPSPARSWTIDHGVHSVAALHVCLWNRKFGFDPRWTPQEMHICPLEILGALSVVTGIRFGWWWLKAKITA
jgi:hypothetical protein